MAAKAKLKTPHPRTLKEKIIENHYSQDNRSFGWNKEAELEEDNQFIKPKKPKTNNSWER